MGKFASKSQSASQPLIVGTKFFTVPWTNLLVGGGFRLGRRSMIDALRASLKRMDRDKIDLYQVRNTPHLGTVVYQRPKGVCSLPALVRLHSALTATASLLAMIASAALTLSQTAKGSTLKCIHTYIELFHSKIEFGETCSHVFVFAYQALDKHLQLWKVEIWKGKFSAGPCVVCRSTSPSPSSSRPLWLMGCKKPWIWAWPQLWASATTTPHSLSKYTAFWIRKAFLLPQIRYPPLL